jgi:hypothetical protein
MGSYSPFSAVNDTSLQLKAHSEAGDFVAEVEDKPSFKTYKTFLIVSGIRPP